MLVRCDPMPAQVHALSLALLRRHLVAAIDLNGQVTHARWNLQGPAAGTFGDPLDQVVAALHYCCDLIVSHTGALGGAVNGTVQAAAAESFLVPYPLNRADARAHAGAVLAALETLAGSLRQAATLARDAGDGDTAALLIDVARCVERQVWLLGSVTATAANTRTATRTMPLLVAEGIAADHPAHRWTDRRPAAPGASPTAAGGHDHGTTAAERTP